MAHYLSAKSFASLCDGAKRIKDDHYIARCPAHDDSSPSLNIQEAKDKLLLHCHAGCEVKQVCEAVGVSMQDLFNSSDDYVKPIYTDDERTFDKFMVAIFETERKKGLSYNERDEEIYVQSKLRLAQHGVLNNGRGLDQV